tara:strand:+ start:38385 stop:40361 length:1977 start_codon:yes stop_codon:yes gene_type:complete
MNTISIADSIKKQTPNILFKEGQIARYNGEIYKIRTAQTDYFVLEHIESGQKQMVNTDVLYQAYVEGGFVLTTENTPVTFRPLTSQKQLVETERRLAYVSELQTREHPGAVRTWEDVVEYTSKRINDLDPPHPKKVYRWLQYWNKCNQNVVRFMNKAQKRASPKLDAQLDLIMQVLDDEYLVTNGNNKSHAYESYKVRFCEEKKLGRQTGTPISKTYFDEVIDSLDPYEVCEAQFGKKASIAKFRASDEKIVTYFMMQRVEIDAVHLNLGLIDDETGEFLGKVIVFLAIDVHTRYILGYSLVYGQKPGETSEAVIELIKNILTPKENSNNYLNIWQLLGLPVQIHCDNGPGFIAENTIRYMCMLGICQHRSETGKGYRRPFIERFNRTFRSQLCKKIPGYQNKRTDEHNFGKTIEQMAQVTVSQFRGYIEQYIVDVYHQRKHKGLEGVTPAEAVEQCLEKFLPRPVPDLAHLNSLTGVSQKGSIQQTHGLQIDNQYFNSPALRKLRYSLMGNKKTNSPKVEFIYNKKDITTITVVVPDTFELLIVPNRDVTIRPGTSLQEYRASRPKVQSNNQPVFSTKVHQQKPIEKHKPCNKSSPATSKANVQNAPMNKVDMDNQRIDAIGRIANDISNHTVKSSTTHEVNQPKAPTRRKRSQVSR